MFAAGCSPTLNKIDYVAWITDVRVGVDQEDTGKDTQERTHKAPALTEADYPFMETVTTAPSWQAWRL